MLTQGLTYRVTMPQLAACAVSVRDAQALHTQASHTQAQAASKTEADHTESFGSVTPRRLIALGIFANLMFWGGLLTPYNASAYPVLAHLHASVTMLGAGLALGGAVAVLMMVIHQVTVRLFSPELTAAVLHFTVVFAFATLSLKVILLS